MKSAYQNLENRYQQIGKLENARSILGWDEAVMMPAGGGDSRNQTLAELALVIQNLIANPEIGTWLRQAEDDRSLSAWQAANVREMKRIYTDNTVIPPELNRKLVLARMNSEQKWRGLRGQNDWKSFLPAQQEVLDLTRESLALLSEQRGLSLYDTALSLYSPGLTTDVVERVFAELKSFLPETINQVIARQTKQKLIRPEGVFPVAAQRELGLDLMRAIGFDFHIGRLDESHHPFCGGTPRDVRVTTRYSEENFVPALMGVLHETGHAMYEQNLPEDWLSQPVGAAAGMAVHESQSLLWEMQVCRSPEFMQFAAPLIQKHLAPHTRNPESLSAENLTLLVTRVTRGFIRVDADEVTYPAHVILRFEIERGLLEGQIRLADLPELWNEKMTAYLGLTTKGNDRNGCMQDVHWPAGLFGYFPAYTFGAIIAAQLFARIEATNPDVRAAAARGDFSRVHAWLKENVWSQGARKTTMDLVRDASGPLSADAFRAHLKKRYLAFEG